MVFLSFARGGPRTYVPASHSTPRLSLACRVTEGEGYQQGALGRRLGMPRCCGRRACVAPKTAMTSASEAGLGAVETSAVSRLGWRRLRGLAGCCTCAKEARSADPKARLSYPRQCRHRVLPERAHD